MRAFPVLWEGARVALPKAGDGGRRQLQVTLGVLAGIPFESGLAGMLIGPAVLPGDNSRIGASLGSEYRYANAFCLRSHH